MYSNRTAKFKIDEEVEEEIKSTKDIIIKHLTNPLPTINTKNTSLEENYQENVDFSFQNELLSNRTYKFLRDKDECLSEMILDDSIPETIQK